MLKQPIEFTWNGSTYRGGKGELTDGGTRVPLVANWPGTIPAGQVVDDLVDFSDWLPTFVELAGGTAGASLDGVSLAAACVAGRGRAGSGLTLPGAAANGSGRSAGSSMTTVASLTWPGGARRSSRSRSAKLPPRPGVPGWSSRQPLASLPALIARLLP